jgi:hypothetical protein
MHHLCHGLQCVVNGGGELSKLQGPALSLALKELRVVAHLQDVVGAGTKGGASATHKHAWPKGD